ncbi:putative sodium/potassium-dependent atpase beta-2 subunit [Operophtera brumata]|uniref:Putative sodium/potassium-dependent atpase beta-2 subunit n=1 Tax=Operophtera brumata TaxID=104452 RepID=A0A0L7L752_OPEBR|nr:putative sodium/potassium-dependent atpase beta-2 subunit [Operophtera brumata]
MGVDKRTVKIIVIVAVVLLVIGGIIGLVLGLVLPRYYVAGSMASLRGVQLEAACDPVPSGRCWKLAYLMRSEACAMAMRMWGPCSADNYYGYADGSPCVFLRLSHQMRSEACAMAMRMWGPCSTDNYYGYADGSPCQMRSEACAMAMRIWGPCSTDNYYGYADGSLCVFLKLSHQMRSEACAMAMRMWGPCSADNYYGYADGSPCQMLSEACAMAMRMWGPCSADNYYGYADGSPCQMRSEACAMAMRMWGPCSPDNYYGYADGSPCVFLRLSHIHYWVPEPYNMTSSLPLPNDMPEQMRTLMLQRPAHQYGDYIWVSCEGEFSSDKENIGPIMFIPLPGFPTSRLHTADRIPYSSRNMPDQVQGPLCRIWSRDIFYDRSSRYGRARFELFVE